MSDEMMKAVESVKSAAEKFNRAAEAAYHRHHLTVKARVSYGKDSYGHTCAPILFIDVSKDL